jgi:hypothetical protein
VEDLREESEASLEDLVAERSELVEGLPEDLRTYVEAGCSISWSKATRAWNLQTRKLDPTTKTVPKDYAHIVERIKELDEEIARAKQHTAARAEVVKADVEAQTSIREARRDARQPIVEKEIEDSAWFHNLLHDLGKFTYHRLVKGVEWGGDEISDYEKAYEKLSGRLNNLLAMEQDPELLERLTVENMKLEAIAFTYKDLHEQVSQSLRVYKWFTDLLIESMDQNNRQRALNQLIASSAIRVAPEALVGGS